MGATRKRNLSLIMGNMEQKYVSTDLLIEERNDALISHLSAMMGKDASYIMNEAIGELIRRYRPVSRNRKPRLKLIKS